MAHVRLDRALTEEYPMGDGGVGQALGHQLQHAAFAVGQPCEWAPGGRRHQLADHLGR